MKLLQRIYLIFVLGITIAGYALIFGDGGYYNRKLLRQEIHHLERKLALLHSENEYLSTEYNRLQQNFTHHGRSQNSLGNQRSRVTILKFDEPRIQKNFSLWQWKNFDFKNIQNVRILFLVTMLILSVGGWLLLGFLNRQNPKVSI